MTRIGSISLACVLGAASWMPLAAQDAKHAVEKSAKATAHVLEGTVTKFDKDAKTITVRTEKGTEETFKVSEKATVHSGKDVGKASEATFKEGEKVTVHYGGSGVHKVAHLIKKAV